MRALYPFYNLPPRAIQDAPLFKHDGDTELAAVVVGTDLVISLVQEDPENKNLRPEYGQVAAHALDGDGNDLAVLGRFESAGAAQLSLAVVVETARRLFPNHLFTPSDGETDPRGGWTTGMVRVQDLLNGDIVRLHGKWCYVMDVWNPQETTTVEGWDQATRMLQDLPDERRVIHYVDDTKSREDMPSHHFLDLVGYDLVEIQTLAQGPA